MTGLGHDEAPVEMTDDISFLGKYNSMQRLCVQPLREREPERVVDVKHDEGRNRQPRRDRAQDIDERTRPPGRCSDRQDAVRLVALDRGYGLHRGLRPTEWAEPGPRMRDHLDARNQLEGR